MDDNKDQNNNEINKLEELEQKITELDNNWKRALADYKNLEKRTADEKEDLVRYSNASLMEKLLPTLDHLEKATEHCDDEGVKLTLKDFKQVLTKEGLAEIEAQGKDFDPSLMEAVDVGDGEKNKVIEVVLKGYLFNDKLIRPTRVKVGNGNKGNN